VAWHIWLMWCGFGVSVWLLWLGFTSRRAGSAVDAIAEANVYLAYGRRDQAIELLKRRLAECPEDQEVRDKLVELGSPV
jgi:hypothetical protein